MKFRVTKRSDWRKKPCDEAIEDVRGEYGYRKYFLELNDLSELMAFMREHGAIVMYGQRIEIIDEYRED